MSLINGCIVIEHLFEKNINERVTKRPRDIMSVDVYYGRGKVHFLWEISQGRSPSLNINWLKTVIACYLAAAIQCELEGAHLQYIFHNSL